MMMRTIGTTLVEIIKNGDTPIEENHILSWATVNITEMPAITVEETTAIDAIGGIEAAAEAIAMTDIIILTEAAMVTPEVAIKKLLLLAALFATLHAQEEPQYWHGPGWYDEVWYDNEDEFLLDKYRNPRPPAPVPGAVPQAVPGPVQPEGQQYNYEPTPPSGDQPEPRVFPQVPQPRVDKYPGKNR
jgi:hypothetical protein